MFTGKVIEAQELRLADHTSDLPAATKQTSGTVMVSGGHLYFANSSGWQQLTS